MRYLRRTTKYPKIIALSDPTHMMSMADLVAIGEETLRKDSGWSLEKEFTEMILYIIINQVYSCHGCGPLTRNTKDIS